MSDITRKKYIQQLPKQFNNAASRQNTWGTYVLEPPIDIWDAQQQSLTP